MKQGTANLAEDYCFIHKALRPVSKALRPVSKARRQIAAVPAANCRGAAVKSKAWLRYKDGKGDPHGFNAFLELSVRYDGCWKTRDFHSIFDVGFVIEVLTGRVIDSK